jgi:CRP/FNR family cyclic AMP-dependent transcriptional regulator
MPAPATDSSDPIASAPLSDSLRALARRGALVRLRPGAQVIVEGELGDTLYIVLSGRLRAYTVDAFERQVTYGEYGPGECIGEMGLDGGPRSAHVEAIEPALCARIVRHVLTQHLQDEPAFAMELVVLVIRRARMATEALQRLALTDVWGRLRAHLEELARLQPDGTRLIDPAPSHRAMSQRLGCTAAAITKTLKPLKEGGYIQADRRRLLLLKPLPRRL